ncbi:cupin domain-containing protein [Natronococcus pandeyae]|uniref:Cupin domain-containing protein n=1 Tax=Natronococcus pandeyae TaxID=2055836 RepID=A0A8J8Q3D9_9EURY|nr:cupin domain-containing protein [Natronococcus pandeyae]TYL37843.1 cupin domain-containing protein [Natronococcus pandeyae]
MASSGHGSGAPTLETSFGERFVLRDTAEETDGELLRMDTYLDPGVRRPLHSHPKQDERFIVHDGTLGIAIEDAEQLLEPGEEKTVAAGTPHTFWNAGDGEVHMTTEHRPALRFEEFIRAMVELDRADGLDADGMPANPLVAAALIHEFQDEMQPADIPVPVQRVLFPVLGTIGSVVGYGVPEYATAESDRSDSL